MNAVTWHVLGAGSMGALAASRLQRAGHGTRLAGRHGVVTHQLHFPEPSTRTVTLDADDGGPIHYLLVAVKAGDTAAALAPLQPRLADDLVLLRLQNGMGTLDGLALPADSRVVHALTTDGAWRDETGIHVVAENQTVAGDGGDQPPAPLNNLALYWPGWQWQVDIEQRQWRKLAINALINPLTALFDCPNGALLDGGERELAMRELAHELDASVPRWLDAWPGDSFRLAREVAQQTAANTSSMRADVRAGRATEIDFINGYLVRCAHAHGLSLPAHDAIIERIHALTP